MLIVEDNADLRTVIADEFREEYRVIFAEDGVEALERATREVPHVIVSDVMMPRMDGFELVAQIRSDPRTSHIPIVLLTARAERDSKIAGLAQGADDYLVKPFDAGELHVRVNNLLESRRLLRERFREQFIISATPVVSESMEEQFLRRVRQEIEQRMGDENFTVEALAGAVGMSRAHLHRKLTALIGKSAGQLIATIRLQRARELLVQGAGSVSEIAFRVGFSSPSYFAKCFKEEFGMSPSEGRTGA